MSQPTALLARLWIDFASMGRFYSRLPVPTLSFEVEPHAVPDFTRAIWAVPVIGAIIGGLAGLFAWIALQIGLSPLIAAVLAISAIILSTGCFHEDGLADSADGFWGGMTIERRLEIMKDSRVGSYGAAALVLSIGLRVACLAEIFRLTGPDGAWLMIGIASFTRACALIPTLVLPLARESGIAKAAPQPRIGGVLWALGLGIVCFAASTSALPMTVFLVIIPAILAIWLAIAIMKAKIAGYTGDTLGASQQLGEMAILLALAAFLAISGPF